MILALLALVFSQDSTPELSYTLSIPSDRLAYAVELRITHPPNPSRLVIPYWAPGAYRPMSSGENISDFIATSAGGEQLPVRRDSPISWVVDTHGAPAITVRYRTGLRDTVQWRRPNNRWYLRATSGVVDGPRTFMYLDGAKLLPAMLTYHLPPRWHVATGLPTSDSVTYWAESYDVLIDSPAMVGAFLSYPFTAAGTPHRAVVDLGGVQPHASRVFVDMLRRIAETGIGIFRGAPYKDYTFIFVAGRGGGLEHLNSTTIGVTAQTLARNPRGARSVSAHEFFHAWNVKRIRPIELGPFDYEHEVRTVNLWWCEGVTDYYADIIVARAGLETPADFARDIAGSIANHHGNAARLRVSPERSSWTVWDPPAVNDDYVISYYLQGELLGFLLDLAIRDSTDNARSLDDVMRHLADRYSGAHGFTRDDLVNSVRRATGRDFAEFWRLYVSGTTEIPWNDYLRAAGWEVVFTEKPAVDARIGSLPPAMQGGRLRAVVTPGSAAAVAGLRTGDELVRINGRRIIDATDVSAAVRAIGRNARVVVEIMRDGQPLVIRFRAGTYQRVRARLVDLPAPTEKMRRIRAGLLHP
ncbi:MAG TPA: PDZ domain-containing protein [Gemmatimonadales bacterium]|nr:PDZ domain-containing protein [Gemmatimonadales bacterium]